jgi:hypothetical protein
MMSKITKEDYNYFENFGEDLIDHSTTFKNSFYIFYSDGDDFDLKYSNGGCFSKDDFNLIDLNGEDILGDDAEAVKCNHYIQRRKLPTVLMLEQAKKFRLAAERRSANAQYNFDF